MDFMQTENIFYFWIQNKTMFLEKLSKKNP